MSDDILDLDKRKKNEYILNPGKSNSKHIMQVILKFDGLNKDIATHYYWHINFPYLVGKGYTNLKLEDHHYFSENSQFGMQMRQIKGGSIKAFQENLAQLVQLIKIHLMPLLKEVKQAEFYNNWFKQITENDALVQKELKKSKEQRDQEKLKQWRGKRNEAINHIKDKWVNEVEGGRMWQMNRPAAEQGLDFALLPQLFFGVNLDDPLNVETLKDQLDGDIYSIDISELAREQVARFLYKFHTWLPTAIKESKYAYSIKISSLKQFYSQLQMYISFMKPLLIEISRKTESFNKENFYKDFEMENPEVVNLFDYSFSFIKLFGIKSFERGGYKIEDLEFSRFGLHVSKKTIKFGRFKGKSGFLFGESEVDGETVYKFLEASNKNISNGEYMSLKDDWKKSPKYVRKDDLSLFPICEYDFDQRRETQVLQTEQGAQQVPYMRNKIVYRAYHWNIYEIASYRASLQVDNLKIMESFIDEIRVIREDLLYYINDLAEISEAEEDKPKKSHSHDSKIDDTLILGPFRALGEMTSALVPGFSHKKKDTKGAFDTKESLKLKGELAEKQDHANFTMADVVEDLWKAYSTFKKTNGFYAYASEENFTKK